jgi:hypothetical protein
LLVFLLASLAVAIWLGSSVFLKRDRLFRGKPESEWVKGIKYWDDEQTKEWRAYGMDGVQVLLRGLRNARRPGERAYRQISRRLPGALRRFLPDPKQDSTRERRHCLVALISNLGPDADIATEEMMDVVLNDENDGIRQSAINFFNSTEDDNSRVNKLPPNQKARLLPGLLSSLENNSNWGLRNNAAISLRFYPERREVVAPALEAALKDPEAPVRMLAAEALNRVDPERALKAGTTALLANIAKHKDDQIAHRAVAALGRKGADTSIAVPALIEALQSSNSLVACQAVWSLEWSPKEFDPHAEKIVAALTTTAERKDNPGGYAKSALKRWKSRIAEGFK